MLWSEILFMLFPTRICPAYETHRAISQSAFLCSACQENARRRSSASSAVTTNERCPHEDSTA